MKVTHLIVLLGLGVSTVSLAGEQGVKFAILVTQAGKVFASPTLFGEFGKTVSVQQDGLMKVDARADRPARDGFAKTAVTLHVFENGAMKPVKDMSMRADLSRTPSFEYTVPGTTTRFVIRPRLATLPAKTS